MGGSGGLALPRAADRAIRWLLWGVVAAGLIAPFLALRVNSLWLDELFSAYFSDPAQPSLAAAIRRSAGDVHPPTYSAILYLLRRAIPGDVEVVGRGFSACCSAGALVVLGLAMRPRYSPLGLVLMMVSAALSTSFLMEATELRSYGLCFLLIAGQIALVVKVMDAVSDGRLPPLAIAAGLAVLLALGGLIHSYLLLLAGAIVAFLILIAPSWRERFGWAVVGLIALGLALAEMRWRLPQVVPDLTQWFRASPAFLRHQLETGLVIAIGSPLALVILLLALPLAPWAAIRRELAQSPRRVAASPAAMALAVIALTVVEALGYSLLVRPMLSFRLFIVLSPFFWLLCGSAVSAMRAGRWSAPLAGLLCAAALFTAPRLAEWSKPAKIEWRASSRAVNRHPVCAEAPIVAAGLDQPYVHDSEAAIFYGHYFAFAPTRLRLIDRSAPPARFAQAIIDAAGRGAALGPRACPILFWSVHHLDRRKVTDIAEELARDPGFPRGYHPVVEGFGHYGLLGLAALPWPRRAPDSERAFVIRLAPNR